MLPRSLLCVNRHDDGWASPAWLTARDTVWVRALVDLFEGRVGQPVGALAGIDAQVTRLAQAHGVSARQAEGLLRVLVRRAGDRLEAPVLPPRARAVVFAEAGADRLAPRSVVLARAAVRLGTTVDAVEASLFADRASARRIGPQPPSSAQELVEAYNLSLAQGLLACSELVVAHVREHLRAVVRFAKLSGLLCTFSAAPGGTRLEISGPLAVLRHTTKYGWSLARFLPAVLATAHHAVEARCLLWDAPLRVRIDARDHLAPGHALPRDADSRVERWLAQDVRRLDGGWVLDRESDVIAAGPRLFFPDFTLRRGGSSVLVEVVGFAGAAYLEAKARALEMVAHRPLVVCVAAPLVRELGAVPGVVLPYRHRIDAAALLGLAEGLLGTDGPST